MRSGARLKFSCKSEKVERRQEIKREKMGKEKVRREHRRGIWIKRMESLREKREKGWRVKRRKG